MFKIPLCWYLQGLTPEPAFDTPVSNRETNPMMPLPWKVWKSFYVFGAKESLGIHVDSEAVGSISISALSLLFDHCGSQTSTFSFVKW